MGQRVKYPKLIGICALAIKNNWCTGCNKLELYEFKGVKECKWVKPPEKENWRQERIKI